MDSNALSPREQEIALLVMTGASNKEIARELALSIKTVKNVLTKVFVKTNTRSRSELAVQLVRSDYERANIVPVGTPLCLHCPLALRSSSKQWNKIANRGATFALDHSKQSGESS